MCTKFSGWHDITTSVTIQSTGWEWCPRKGPGPPDWFPCPWAALVPHSCGKGCLSFARWFLTEEFFKMLLGFQLWQEKQSFLKKGWASVQLWRKLPVDDIRHSPQSQQFGEGDRGPWLHPGPQHHPAMATFQSCSERLLLPPDWGFGCL